MYSENRTLIAWNVSEKVKLTVAYNEKARAWATSVFGLNSSATVVNISDLTLVNNLLNNNGIETRVTPVFGLNSDDTVVNISDFTLGINLLDNNGIETWDTPVFGLCSSYNFVIKSVF